MKILWQHLPERKSCVVKILWSVFAMIFVSFGIYLQLKADIGLSPWNALNQGLSNVLPISVPIKASEEFIWKGTACITVP